MDDQRKTRKTTTWAVVLGSVSICCLLAVVVIGLSGDGKKDCKPASDLQNQWVSEAVNHWNPQFSTGEAYAVKSPDHDLYFVAAMILGPGLGDEGAGPGVWAIFGTPDEPGMMISVNQVAAASSNFPLGSTTDFNFTMEMEGAREAERCAKP